MKIPLQGFWLHGSTVALMAAASFNTAWGQENPSSGVETVTVTGTSIHGVAPVGSDLITVTTADIQNSGAQTMMDIFRDTPALSNMGAEPQSNLVNTYFSPNIHQIGASTGNSTLVISDGVRLPLGSTLVSLTDPSMIPTIAIDRVDVLATGASSIYGSDAIAGVINFITRKNYDGLEIQAQAGFADSYLRDSSGLLWGHNWNGGNAMLALEYSYASSLRANARSYLDPNQTARATAAGLPTSTSNTVTDFDNFNCSPATIQPGGSGPIYLSATATAAVANTPANSPCNANAYGDLLPSELRESARVQLSQEFGNLTVSTALNYSYREERAIQSRGTLNTIVYGSGPQANPFYVNPPGVTATTQQIRWDADALLGPGATNNNSAGGVASDLYMHNNAVYHFGGDINLTYDNVFGQDRSYSNTLGALCSSCANLALNGTTNAAGNTTTVSVPGTTQLVLQLPLTTANALDVWDPPGPTNKTSAAVLAGLTDSTVLNTSFTSTEQHRLILDGPLFNLPGGPIKFALGGEYYRVTIAQEISQPNNTGPASFGASARLFHYGRRIGSMFAEFDVPLIAPEMAIPLVKKFEVDISGRYDSLSDVGNTANPKFAANWDVIDGLAFKANYSTAFVPPAPFSFGDASQGYLFSAASLSATTAPLTVPVANFPQIAGALPGCAVGATVCQLTSATPGISGVYGGGTGLHPAKGDDWSVSANFAPSFLSGFEINVTLFNDKAKGLPGTPSPTLLVNVPSLTPRFTICPTGCSAAQLAPELSLNLPISGSLPPTIYYIANTRQVNLIYLQVEGIDLSATYEFDWTDIGHIKLSDSTTQYLTFNYAAGAGSPYFSVLGTAGYTNTFNAIANFTTVHVDWADPSGTFEAGLYADYTAGYHNWSANSVTLVVKDTNQNPIGGGDPVRANLLFDLHAAYNFSEGALTGDQIYFDARNLFNKTPPFYNGATGYNNFSSSAIGRLLELGVRAKF